jgi:hypothetical protein
MRVFIADVANEDLLLVVPALEVASRQFQKVLCWRIGKYGDIFFGNVAY